MSLSATSANLQSILNAALDSYTKQTGIDLTHHPSADRFQNCVAVEDVLQLLRDRETAFKDYRIKNRKLFDCLRPVVQVVHGFSSILGEVAGLVPFGPTKAVFVGIDVLFAAAIDVSSSYDALVDLFECLENFLMRLHIYTEKIPLPLVMADLLVKIIVEVLEVLSLVTKQIKQGRFAKFAKKLLGERDIEAVLQRLDRLTHKEARVTVAHTLEVVYGLLNNLRIVMDDGKATLGGIRQALVEIQDMANEINKMKRDQLQEKFRNWLIPPDPSTNHNVSLRLHHDGTAAWFTQGTIFKAWKETGSLLWIHGKPGSGKSILCSSIIQEIEGLHDAGLAQMAYFYCDFRDPKKQDVSGLLASLLAQFSAKSDPCYNVLSALYSKYDAGSRQPTEVALTECLKAVLNTKGQPPIFIFIDAVDECPNSTDIVSPRDRVLALVEKLAVLRLPHVRICLTSRPEADIRASLGSLASHTISLHDQNGQSDDIADYVRSVVHTDRNMRKWREEDKELVIEALSLKADGMFRWIVCQLVMLRRCLPARIRRALDDLPRSLDETYDRILLSIGEERWDYAQRLFQCLAVSIRPLRVDELAEVLAIQFNAGALPSYDVTLRPEDSQDAILSTCSSLIMIVDVNGSPMVQFSHFSVKEYLSSDRLAKAGEELSRYHIVPGSAHTVLAQASLSILRTLGDQVDKSLMKNCPFAIYAARHWVDHAQFENASSSIEDEMELLFDSTESHFTTWVWIYDVDYPFREVMFAEYPTPPEAVPLYYATLCGFIGLVERLIATCPQDVNARGGFYATPLHAAVAKGNLVMARLLLAHKADVTALNDELLTPLHWASRRGHRETVEFLIKHYADIDIQDDCGQTSLMLASRYGQQDIVNLLLQCGAAVDISDHNSWTPLMLASRDGQADVARLLLQKGAALDSRDDNGWTPLMFASGYGHPDIVSLSLQNGAAVNDHDDDGWTSLMLASENGHLDIVRLLLQNGAAVDSHHNDGWTSLMPATQNGHLDVVRLLLQNGATVDPRDKDGRTPLMSASRAGHQHIVHSLLQQGAAVNSHDKNDWTALMSASQAGHSDIVCLLLQNGAAVDSQGKNGLSPCGDVYAQDVIRCSPLHLASANGHLRAAELVIEHGAEVDKRNEDQETPLDLASSNGQLEITRLLLKSGSDVNLQDTKGRTPLHRAAQSGHLQIVGLLLESGAEVNIRDDDNKTPLDVASVSGKPEVTKFLVERMGAVDFQAAMVTTQLDTTSQNPTLIDSGKVLLDREQGTTRADSGKEISLHTASEEGNLAIAQSLLDSGAEVNKRDALQRTPLDRASRKGRYEVASLLIRHGADVDSRDKFGRTALHKASQAGHPDMVRLLLDHGADVNVTEQANWTPLHLASYGRHRNVVRLLLERGANVHARTDEDSTPYSLASRNSEREIVQLLLKYGAPPR